MATNRLWVIGTAFVVILILAGTWFLGVSPQLSATDKAVADLLAVEQQNLRQEQTLEGLKNQFANLDEITTALEALRASVPVDRNETPLLAQIDTWAEENNVFIEVVAFDNPTVWVPVDATDPEVIDAMTHVSDGNFFVLPVRIQATALQTERLLSFLDEIQHGTRYLLVHEVSVGAVNESDRSEGYRLTVNAQMFVLRPAGSGTPPAEEPGNEVVRGTPAT